MDIPIVIPQWRYYPANRQIDTIPDGLVELYHHSGDADSVRRLRIRWKQCVLELLPTKGLSIFARNIDGEPACWAPPLDAINAPDTMHLQDPLLINGEVAP